MLQPQHYPVALLVLAAWSSHAATTSAPGPASSSVFVAECAPETVANTVGVDVSMTYGYVESTAAVAFTVQFPAPVVAWAGLGIREGSLNGMVGLDIAVFDSVTAFVQDCHPLGLSTRPPVDTIQNTNLISHDSAGGFVTVSWWRYVFTGDIAGDNNITDTFNMGIATGIGTVSDNTYQKHTSAQIVVVSHVCNPPPTSAPDTVAPTSLAPSTSAPSQAPPTTGPSQAPSTTAPSQAPETTAPSQAPPTTAPSQSPETTAPTTAPSQTPETTAPSQAPATAAPSQAPATTAPSQTPETTAPSQAPETTAPSHAPETSAPSQAPETTAPSQAPPTTTPSQAPETTAPSQAPETTAPSQAPATTAPSQAPPTTTPSQAPATSEPSQSPVTSAPQEGPPTAVPGGSNSRFSFLQSCEEVRINEGEVEIAYSTGVIRDEEDDDFAAALQFEITFPSEDEVNFAGIGLRTENTSSNGMEDLVITAFDSDNSPVVEFEKMEASEKPSSTDTSQDSYLASRTFASRRTTVVFYRKLDTGDGNDFELAPGAAVTLAWAFGSGSVTLDTWSKHSQAGTVPVVLEAQSRCYVRALTPETDGDGVSTGLIIGIVAGVVVLALLIVGAVAWTRRRRTGSDEEMGIDEFMNTLHATEFDDFLLTTNQFSEMEDFDDTKDGIGFGLSRHLQL